MLKIKVLYVEDEPFLAKIVRESLENKGFAVRLSKDGRGVLPSFAEWRPDICVLDVMLPYRDGFELSAAIRERDPDVPILFVTAKQATEDVVKGFAVGGNDYIRKPFSMEELVARMHNLLRLRQNRPTTAAADETITFGTFTFTPRSLELRAASGHPIRLTHREGEILRLLCEHRNATLERKHLLLSVWGDDSFFNSRNLDVYIRKLRTYLAEDPGVRILTLKGVGYRFVVEG